MRELLASKLRRMASQEESCGPRSFKLRDRHTINLREDAQPPGPWPHGTREDERLSEKGAQVGCRRQRLGEPKHDQGRSGGWLSPQRRRRERTLSRRAGRPERHRNRRSHTRSGGCHHESESASAVSHRCEARSSLLSGPICSNAARDLARSALQLQPFFGLQAAVGIAFAKDVTAALSMVRRDWPALEGILGASPCQGMSSDPDLADGQWRRPDTARSSQSGSRLPARPPA